MKHCVLRTHARCHCDTRTPKSYQLAGQYFTAEPFSLIFHAIFSRNACDVFNRRKSNRYRCFIICCCFCLSSVVRELAVVFVKTTSLQVNGRIIFTLQLESCEPKRLQSPFERVFDHILIRSENSVNQRILYTL